jgi:hypothetical protein
MPDSTYQPKVYREQGGSRQVIASGGSCDVESGGEIDVESGGALKLAGTDVTSKLVAQAAQSGGMAVGTVAAAGNAQGNGGAIAGDLCVVTAADGTKGVVLPAGAIGRRVTVKNNANAVLKVYPASGGTINAIAQDGAISMAAFTCCDFVAQTATQWFTLPLLPS